MEIVEAFVYGVYGACLGLAAIAGMCVPLGMIALGVWMGHKIYFGLGGK